MIQPSPMPSLVEPALYRREVLPDELDRDPPQGPAGVRQLLDAFFNAVRAGDTKLALLLCMGMAADNGLMGEVIIAAGRDFGLDVGDP